MIDACATEQTPTPVRRAACYPKSISTLADTLAFVRRELWPHEGCSLSTRDPNSVKRPRQFVEVSDRDHLLRCLKGQSRSGS